MNIKLDENLPASLVGALAKLGHDVDTVVAEGLAGETDNVVCQAAQDARRFLITQDLDFSDIRRFAPGTHLRYPLGSSLSTRSPGSARTDSRRLSQ